MPPQEQSVTFTASRALILSGTTALSVGTIIAGKGFGGLAGAAIEAPHLPPAIVPVLILYLAVLVFLSLLIFLGVRAFRRPRQLTITGDDITEMVNGEARSARWEDLTNPVERRVSLGTVSVIEIELKRASGGSFAVRIDIYPVFDQILSVIEDAMAGRPITKPVSDTRNRAYFVLTFAALVSIVALVHVWTT